MRKEDSMTELLPGPGAVTVAIIGGGLSGAAVAYRLALETPSPALRILVIEPRADLGRGLAYSTPDPEHRLNVPHVKMSLRTEEPAHFADWLSSPEAPALPAGSATLSGQIFAPRAVFGAYVGRTLAPLLEEGRIRHLQGRAADIRRAGNRFRIALDDGPEVVADSVILAIAHPEPALPPALRPLHGTSQLVADPFAPGALDGIGANERLLVVGSGLTSADILATLDRRGHAGPIHVISRHGWRSKQHGPAQEETAEDFTRNPARTALGLLRRVRAALADDAELGLTWHAVFDRLRAQGPAIWAALPLAERRRFLRHLRGLWDVHRFRIAPQTAEVLDRMERSHRLRFLTGRLVSADVAPDGLRLHWRARGASGLSPLAADRIVLATGPDHSRVTETNALLRALAAGGLIARDPLRLGIHTAPEGTAIAADGSTRPGLYIAGPLARGTVGELMGVPEVTAWAEHVARRVIRDLQSQLPQPAGSGTG